MTRGLRQTCCCSHRGLFTALRSRPRPVYHRTWQVRFAFLSTTITRTCLSSNETAPSCLLLTSVSHLLTYAALASLSIDDIDAAADAADEAEAAAAAAEEGEGRLHKAKSAAIAAGEETSSEERHPLKSESAEGAPVIKNFNLRRRDKAIKHYCRTSVARWDPSLRSLPLITSVVFGDDIVPRLTLVSLAHLIVQVS